MRIAVIGASGNLGMAALRRLAAVPGITDVLGIARRSPRASLPEVRWLERDVTRDHLADDLRGSDVVVHLAWAIQPSRRLDVLRATNVDGSRRVFAAAAEAGVPAIVYASSVGAYAPGSKREAVGESWPTHGIPSSHYSRHKVAVERILDRFEREHPAVRVVRLRPALVFGRTPGSEIRRYFGGPLLPTSLLRRATLPVVPDLPRLRFQVVHRDDVAEAIRLAAVSGERGAFNLAAPPVLDAARLAHILGARRISVPAGVVRAAAGLTWALRLQPTPPGWLDMGLSVPIMSTARARERLGWMPAKTAERALIELLKGMREGAGDDTPPLDADRGIRQRVREAGRELAGGVR